MYQGPQSYGVPQGQGVPQGHGGYNPQGGNTVHGPYIPTVHGPDIKGYKPQGGNTVHGPDIHTIHGPDIHAIHGPDIHAIHGPDIRGYKPPDVGYTSYGEYNQPQIDLKNPPQNYHEHPINYSNSINDSCKICQQTITGQPGYKCGSCQLILCLNCGKKVFYGKRNISFHPHSLTLMIRQAWRCNLCNQRYRNSASFYCKECDYDICTSCYVSY